MEDYVREIQTRGIKTATTSDVARTRNSAAVGRMKSNKEIAQLLNLSLYTVETHRRNLQEKLNLHSVAELILYAVRKGIIS